MPGDIEERLEKLEEENKKLKEIIRRDYLESKEEKSDSVTRRDFLKKIGLGAASIGVLGFSSVSALRLTDDKILDNGSPVFLDLPGSNTMSGNLKLGGNNITGAEMVDASVQSLTNHSVVLQKDTDQSLTADTEITVNWDLQDVDTGLYSYDSSNHQVTVTESGDYRINATITFNNHSDQDDMWIRLFHNGNRIRSKNMNASGSSAFQFTLTALIKNIASGDTISIGVRSSASNKIVGGTGQTYASISKEA